MFSIVFISIQVISRRLYIDIPVISRIWLSVFPPPEIKESVQCSHVSLCNQKSPGIRLK